MSEVIFGLAEQPFDAPTGPWYEGSCSPDLVGADSLGFAISPSPALAASTMDQTGPATTTATAVLQAPEPPAAPSKKLNLQIAPPVAKSQNALTRELDANGRRINKRRHVQIRVSFMACVRQTDSEDEIVECENVSKGGVCFHSLKQYALDSLIAVAAPFSPGEPALFVSAPSSASKRSPAARFSATASSDLKRPAPAPSR